VVFIERWNMLLNMQPDENNLIKSHIKFSQARNETEEVRPNFGPKDIIMQYFGMGM
jgi:hypothetical protein